MKKSHIRPELPTVSTEPKWTIFLMFFLEPSAPNAVYMMPAAFYLLIPAILLVILLIVTVIYLCKKKESTLKRLAEKRRIKNYLGDSLSAQPLAEDSSIEVWSVMPSALSQLYTFFHRPPTRPTRWSSFWLLQLQLILVHRSNKTTTDWSNSRNHINWRVLNLEASRTYSWHWFWTLQLLLRMRVN